MPSVGLLGQVQSTTTPGPAADWRFDYVARRCGS